MNAISFRETESVRWRVPAIPMLWLHSLKMGCTSACLFSKFIFNGKEVQLLSLLGSLDCVNQLRQNVHIVFLFFFFFWAQKKKGRMLWEQAITVSLCDSTHEALSEAPKQLTTLRKQGCIDGFMQFNVKLISCAVHYVYVGSVKG